MCADDQDPLGMPGDTESFAGYMRLMGIVLIAVSVIEFGVGAAAYDFLTTFHIGGWWAGLVPCIAAIFALLSVHKVVVITGGVFAIFGIFVAIAAASNDGVQATKINRLAGCINTDNGDSYGTATGVSYATNCFTNSMAFDYYGSSNSQCVCADYAQHCYGYSLRWGDDCSSLFSTYFNELTASCVICSFLSVLCLMYSVFTCVSCCTPKPFPTQNTTIQPPTQPMPVQYVVNQPTQYVVTQPQVYLVPAAQQQPVVYYVNAPPVTVVQQQPYYQPIVDVPQSEIVVTHMNAKY